MMHKRMNSQPLIPALAWTATTAVFGILAYTRPQSDGNSLFLFIAILGAVNTVIWWKNVFLAGRKGPK